jgi:uncharacterized protein YjbI with pentapeptide repeats
MPDEKPSQHNETPEGQGCQVKMEDGPCGRAIYESTASGQLCLMHSRDANKDNAAFQAQFERILQEAGTRTADFTGFVFPDRDYSRRKFKARCVFRGATFTKGAEFMGTIFIQDASFFEVTFTQRTDFIKTIFMQRAHFGDATFTENANFGLATFTQGASFIRAIFTQRADFSKATFAEDARFFKATFTGDATFSWATFTQEADFSQATFARFVFFDYATFTQEADFSQATFARSVYFDSATFTQRVMFNDAGFTEKADFTTAWFLGSVEFRKTSFRNDGTREPGPIFSVTYFKQPEAVTFYKTYLGQALFHNCDVSRFTFSDVRWLKRKKGKSMVFEEEVDLQRAEAEALKPNHGELDKLNYGLIAELYQQLKKNYDDRRDYWTAGDFHYGELEMKRLHSASRRKWEHWRHRTLGLAALYKYTSAYGESYMWPVPWLGGVLLFFGLLYPCFGLAPAAGAGPPVSYASPCGVGIWRAWFIPLGKGLLTSWEVATFQRYSFYRSDSPWVHLLQPVQLLLVSILVALFLLALRRQFATLGK